MSATSVCRSVQVGVLLRECADAIYLMCLTTAGSRPALVYTSLPLLANKFPVTLSRTDVLCTPLRQHWMTLSLPSCLCRTSACAKKKHAQDLGVW